MGPIKAVIFWVGFAGMRFIPRITAMRPAAHLDTTHSSRGVYEFPVSYYVCREVSIAVLLMDAEKVYFEEKESQIVVA
jgi:hypothetical protein